MKHEQQHEPQLNITFEVIAYDEGGYGENCSKNFTNGEEAVAYAQSLEKRFYASVYKRITMQPMSIKLWPQ